MRESLFICAICQKDVVDYRDRNGRDRHISPLCRYCESERGGRKPTAGSFMDRRIVMHVGALADALLGTANCMRWEGRA